MTLEGIAAIAHTYRVEACTRLSCQHLGAVVVDEDVVDSPEPMERSRVTLADIDLVLLAPTVHPAR